MIEELIQMHTQQEDDRLVALRELNILDTPAEQAYDDITELAAFICDTPVSLVSLVAEKRQFFKSAHGFGRSETPRDYSFCAHTIPTAQTLVVEDATKDERFAQNPLVTGGPHIRFYAGAPILSDEGHVFGTVCVIDSVPHSLSKKQLDALERLARQASNLLNRRALSLSNTKLEADAIVAAERSEREREKLQTSLDAAEVAAWFYDPVSNVVGGDVRMGELFGLNVPEAPAELWLAAIVEEDRARVGKEFASGLSGALYDTKYRVMVDGEIRWLHARAKSTPNADGSVRMAGICEDITREELLSSELAESEALLHRERQAAAERLNLESVRLQLSLSTINATSFDWTPATDEVRWSGMPPFGVDPADIPTGRSSLEYVQVEDRAELTAVLTKAMESGEPYAHEYRARWANDSTRWVRTAGRAFVESDGTTRFLGVNTDITERKLAEEALLHTEKLSAVGRLASVISHEINNPLEAVTNLLYIVRASPTLSRDDREHLELADRELARVSHITAQQLRLHRSSDHPEPVDADKLAQELVTLYRSRLTASNIRVKLDLAENVKFNAFEGDIRQVLNHLIGNAYDAMRKGGNLRIRTRCSSDPKTGEMGALISVADDGPGIPLEMRDRIFEAFYSTKGINGNGLGLWICKRILHKHRGHLRFRSSVGSIHGTVFRLWLPLQAATTAAEVWA